MAPSSRIRRDRVKLYDRDGGLSRNCLPILVGWMVSILAYKMHPADRGRLASTRTSIRTDANGDRGVRDNGVTAAFTRETAIRKVRAAKDDWNSCDPERVSLAYSVKSEWRNRAVRARTSRYRSLLAQKWASELEHADRRVGRGLLRSTKPRCIRTKARRLRGPTPRVSVQPPVRDGCCWCCCIWCPAAWAFSARRRVRHTVRDALLPGHNVGTQPIARMASSPGARKARS
jgi:hypothetical protein